MIHGGSFQTVRSRNPKSASAKSRGVNTALVQTGYKRRTENADHGGVGAAHGGLGRWAGSCRIPERQHTVDEQHAGRSSATSAMDAPARPFWRRVHDGAR